MTPPANIDILSTYGYASDEEREMMRTGDFQPGMRPNRYDWMSGLLVETIANIKRINNRSKTARNDEARLARREACYHLHGALDIPQISEWQPADFAKRL